MKLALHGRVALVTGAAKRIGRAVAVRLAAEGADVVIHYNRSKAEADAAVAEIEKLGRKGVALQADLCNLADIKRLFQQTAEQFGRLDILVNSAANFLPAHLADTTEKMWDASLDTNLKAPFFCAQAAAPLLKQSHGVIINFADIGGILPWPGYIPHCASKAGVIMLKWEADFIRRAPLHRTGTTDDVADAVSFLIHSTFITGHILVLDGGRTL